MCKDCELENKENIDVTDKVSDKVKSHLLNNLVKYRRRFDIPRDKKLVLRHSDRDDKRFSLFEDDKKVADFGFAKKENGVKYHAQTFIDLIDKSPRKAQIKKRDYIARAREIRNNEGEQTHTKKYSPNSLSYWLLWHCPMCH